MTTELKKLLKEFLVGMEPESPASDELMFQLRETFPELDNEFKVFFSLANGAKGWPFGQNHCLTRIHGIDTLSRLDDGAIEIGYVRISDIETVRVSDIVFRPNKSLGQYEVVSRSTEKPLAIGDRFSLLFKNIRETVNAFNEKRLQRWELSDGVFERSPIEEFDRPDGLQLKFPFLEYRDHICGAINLADVLFRADGSVVYMTQEKRRFHSFSLVTKAYRFHVCKPIRADEPPARWFVTHTNLILRFVGKKKRDVIDLASGEIVHTFPARELHIGIPERSGFQGDLLAINTSPLDCFVVSTYDITQRRYTPVFLIETDDDEWVVQSAHIDDFGSRLVIILGVIGIGAGGYSRNQTRVYDDKGTELVRFDTDWHGYMKFSHDGAKLLPGAVRERLQVYDAQTGELAIDHEVRKNKKGPQVYVPCPLLELTGQVLCFPNSRLTAINFFDLNTGKKIGRYSKFGSFDQITAFDTGRKLCISYRGEAYIFDAAQLIQYVRDGQPQA